MRRPHGYAFLTRNLLAAIRTYRYQVEILRIVGLVGPSTTRELMVYCAPRIPMSLGKLRSLLTHLRHARALMAYPVGSAQYCAEVAWALPTQPKPRRQERRQFIRPVETDRRIEERRSRGSWWIQADRESFTEALGQRWNG